MPIYLVELIRYMQHDRKIKKEEFDKIENIAIIKPGFNPAFFTVEDLVMGFDFKKIRKLVNAGYKDGESGLKVEGIVYNPDYSICYDEYDNLTA
ncbi:MAG: hypothetical protein QXL94_02755, partial [Candidatus Parvarchaeum sp.]